MDLAGFGDPADKHHFKSILLRFPPPPSPQPQLQARLPQVACAPDLSQLAGPPFRISFMCVSRTLPSPDLAKSPLPG